MVTISGWGAQPKEYLPLGEKELVFKGGDYIHPCSTGEAGNGESGAKRNAVFKMGSSSYKANHRLAVLHLKWVNHSLAMGSTLQLLLQVNHAPAVGSTSNNATYATKHLLAVDTTLKPSYLCIRIMHWLLPILDQASCTKKLLTDSCFQALNKFWSSKE